MVVPWQRHIILTRRKRIHFYTCLCHDILQMHILNIKKWVILSHKNRNSIIQLFGHCIATWYAMSWSLVNANGDRNQLGHV